MSFTSYLQGEIIPFFNPTVTSKQYEVTFNLQGIVANDPVSLKDFFDDWEGAYTPEKKDNVVLEEFRIDIGTLLDDSYYVGYFYTYNLLAVTNRDFVDFYHAIKNDTQFNTEQNYKISLDMQGMEQHGILLAKSMPLLETESHSLMIGASAYLSYATDVQQGSLSGVSSISVDQTYSATASTDYYYMTNLLYDLDVEKTYGVGYGVDLALLYTNTTYGFEIQMIVNNLAAKSHWKNLPYSYVDIETSNQAINANGHVEYEPTISGLETYKDYVQNIKPKYHIDVKKHFPKKVDLIIGLDSIEDVNIPYLAISKMFNETQKVELLYETRFNSIRVHYEDVNYNLSILSNGFTEASAIGISGRYVYTF